MRQTLLAILALSVPGAAHAQAENKANPPAPIVQPGPPVAVNPTTPPGSTVVVGGQGANSGPGASATIARSGTGAATIMTDPATGSNAGQPSRAVPQEGKGGGGGGGL